MPIKSFDLRASFLAVCLVFPWLNGYVAAPLYDFWPWLSAAVCAVFIALIWARVTAELLATTWLLAALISCIFALLQYFGWASALDPWIFHAQTGEAFANLRQRNHFATLTSIGMVALLTFVAQLTASTCRSDDPKNSAGASSAGLRDAAASQAPLTGSMRLAAALLAAGNAASNSRTGLLEWVLILGISVWWSHKRASRAPRLAVEALLVYAVCAAALPWLLGMLTGLDNASLFGRLAEAQRDSRLVLWSNMLDLIAQKPWLGWGWGELSYAHFITDYSGARFKEDPLSNAHNLPLHLAVELGIPFTLTAGVGLLWMLRSAKPWRETQPGRQMAWGVLAILALHSLLEYPLWYGPFQLALLLSTAWLWKTRPGKSQVAPALANSTSRLRRTIPGLTAACALLVLGFASLDYVRVSQLYLEPQDRLPMYRDDTLSKVGNSWLFSQQVRFALVQGSAVTPASANEVLAMAMISMHYSAQPKVAEKIIASAIETGQLDKARFFLDRYRRAFPNDYLGWALANPAQAKLAAAAFPSDKPSAK